MVKVEEIIQGWSGEGQVFFSCWCWHLGYVGHSELACLSQHFNCADSFQAWRQQSEDCLISKVPVKPRRWEKFQKENKTLICQDRFAGCRSEQKAAECLWPATWIWPCWTFPSPCMRNRTCLNQNDLGRPQLVSVHFVFKTFLKVNSCFLYQFYSEGFVKFLRCWGFVSTVVSYIKLSLSFFRNMVLLL